MFAKICESGFNYSTTTLDTLLPLSLFREKVREVLSFQVFLDKLNGIHWILFSEWRLSTTCSALIGIRSGARVRKSGISTINFSQLSLKIFNLKLFNPNFRFKQLTLCGHCDDGKSNDWVSIRWFSPDFTIEFPFRNWPFDRHRPMDIIEQDFYCLKLRH